MKRKPALLIFDVNETLLDMQPLRIAINEGVGSALAFDHWFAKLLQFSLVETVTGTYHDFAEIGTAVLSMTAKKFSAEISEGRIKEILGNMVYLDPHPEVPGALEKLKANGYRLVALSNGGQSTVEKQLKKAKIEHFFEEIYSVEAVRKFKPHPEPYQYVLKHQRVQAADGMLLAAHAWDITGAQRAGLQTAFVERPGKSLYPLSRQPEISARELADIAKTLSALG